MTQNPDPGVDTLKERAATVLRLAKDLGASQAETNATFGSGMSVTARQRDVETLEYHRGQGLDVTVWFGQRKGSASTSDMSAAALEETVRKACSLARYAAEDEYSGLADPERMAIDVPDLDLCHPWALEPADAIELAKACEAAALDSDARITNSEGATVSTHAGVRVYGNSHGFLEGYRDSSHSLSCAVIAGDGTVMERDFEYTTSRNPDELDSAAAVGAAAGERAVQRLGARKLDTRIAPVLFPARIARGLIGHLFGAISGGSLYRKATFMLDALGAQILPEFVTIEERPHIRGALGSAPYDAEGVATTDRSVVTAGVLQGYVLSSYYARKLGLETTGNAGGLHNILVSDTGQGWADLLTELDTGFIVNELMGQGVNPVTGDYSRGAAGYWVENGEIQFPVSEVTVAGNLIEMYRQIRAVGADTDFRGSIRTGSILVDGMTVAGS